MLPSLEFGFTRIEQGLVMGESDIANDMEDCGRQVGKQLVIDW